MKRTLFISALLALFLISCEGPEGPMGPMGPAGQNGQNGQDGRDGKDGKDGEGGVGWYVTSVTVNESEWRLAGEENALNSYFYVYKKVEGLNSNVYKNGTVIAYIETEPGVKNGMPYVLHKGEEDGGKEFLWTQTYDFDFDDSEMGFYVTYSDFTTTIRPGTETFHVVMMW